VREIKIGVWGLIRVVDDSENTGGFLILTSADPAGLTDVHDAWAESVVDVGLYMDESAWEIEWDADTGTATSHD
jgi:hypothetical protein